MAEVGHGQYVKIGPTDKSLALQSLREELQAIDDYDERIESTEDEALKETLTHARNEEYQHAGMLIEWLCRNDGGFSAAMRYSIDPASNAVGE